MLSVKNEYARADIERLLQEHTDRMGISREELNKEIREGLSCYDLLCTLTGDMIQTVRERESAELRRRQREGMTRAQEQGVTLGRPSKRSDKRFDKIRAMYEKKESLRKRLPSVCTYQSAHFTVGCVKAVRQM